MTAVQPGWYPDPSTPGQVRYHDGQVWTWHVQPDPSAVTIQQVAPSLPAPAPVDRYAVHPQPVAAPTPPMVQQVQINQIGMVRPRKSVGLALLLTFLFGPFGMFYTTVAGGIVMLLANLILGTATLGIFLIISWPIQMIWAAVAANNANAQIAGVNVTSNSAPGPPPVLPVRSYPVTGSTTAWPTASQEPQPQAHEPPAPPRARGQAGQRTGGTGAEGDAEPDTRPWYQ